MEADKHVFSMPLTQWLGLCPDGKHYRPVENGDLRTGGKILRVEVLLNTNVSGSLGNHRDALTIVRVVEYAQEVICHGPDGERTFPIAQLLADEIGFFEQSLWGSKSRRGIVGVAFIVER